MIDRPIGGRAILPLAQPKEKNDMYPNQYNEEERYRILDDEEQWCFDAYYKRGYSLEDIIKSKFIHPNRLCEILLLTPFEDVDIWGLTAFYTRCWGKELR